MPTSLPGAADLLAVVREFLETDILPDPSMGDEKRFNVRIAVNILATVERELRLAPAANAAEEERLTAMVGADGSLDERIRRLADAIRSGAIASDDQQLIDHLRRTLVEALRINNPKWLDS